MLELAKSPVYKPEIILLDSVLNKHRTVGKERFVENPYWLYTNAKVPLYEKYQRGPFEISTGPIGSFTSEEMAIIVQGTTDSYIEEGTFNGFPVEDSNIVDELVSVMMDGFNDQRLVVSVKDTISGIIVGGCMIIPGVSPQTLEELSGNPKSVLPTLSALSFSPGNYARTREREAVCYTRYYRTSDGDINPLIEESGINKRGYLGNFGREVLSAMVRTADYWGKTNDVDLQLGILDTHDQGIIKTLTQYYAGEIITSQPNATESVRLPHPLGYHYDEDLGIQVIGFNFKNHLLAAEKTDKELGKKISIEY